MTVITTSESADVDASLEEYAAGFRVVAEMGSPVITRADRRRA